MGETATFANYSSYVHGINGMIIDLEGAWSGLDETDFSFKVGNDDFPDTWADAPAPLSISFLEQGGSGGADRVTLIWDDGVISNQWLEVKVLANDRTGLAEDNVFYFGSAIAECGNVTTDARVNTLDIAIVRLNLSGFFTVGLDNHYDFNRDGRVNTLDISIVRNSLSSFFPLKLITPTAGSAKGQSRESEVAEQRSRLSSPSAKQIAVPMAMSKTVETSQQKVRRN